MTINNPKYKIFIMKLKILNKVIKEQNYIIQSTSTICLANISENQIA